MAAATDTLSAPAPQREITRPDPDPRSRRVSPFGTKITLPAEETSLYDLMCRLEGVEDTLRQLANVEEGMVFDPSALDLPWRELRRVRLALAEACGCGD